MRIRKTLTSVLTLAVLMAFSPLANLQAASFADPGLRQGAEHLVLAVKAKKKAKSKTAAHKSGKKHHAKRAGSKGPGRCGAYMYYKGGKCMDARAKK
jgi:hypothetical protein